MLSRFIPFFLFTACVQPVANVVVQGNVPAPTFTVGDMSITLDSGGVATSAMIQVGDEPSEVPDRLLAAFVRLGWEVPDDEA